MSELQKYIVVFRDDTSKEVIENVINQINDTGGEVTNRFNSIMKGFSAKLSDVQLQSLDSLQGGVIEYIEPDGIVTTQ